MTYGIHFRTRSLLQEVSLTSASMQDRTASVKLIADDWIDYMHVLKLNGTWQLVNVLWQYKDSDAH